MRYHNALSTVSQAHTLYFGTKRDSRLKCANLFRSTHYIDNNIRNRLDIIILYIFNNSVTWYKTIFNAELIAEIQNLKEEITQKVEIVIDFTPAQQILVDFAVEFDFDLEIVKIFELFVNDLTFSPDVTIIEMKKTILDYFIQLDISLENMTKIYGMLSNAEFSTNFGKLKFQT